MKINHEITKTHILNILGLLKGQAENAAAYKNQKIAVESNNTLSQSYQQEQIEKLRVDYLSTLKATKERIHEQLDIILMHEAEQDKILEFDVPEYSNTIATINATQGKLPYEVIESIKYNFAGQYQNLLAIKALFETYGIDVLKHGYAEYIKSAETAIFEISTKVTNIETSEDSSFISLRNIFRNAILFGEVRGIKFTDEEIDFGALNNDAADEELAKKAMGLN